MEIQEIEVSCDPKRIEQSYSTNQRFCLWQMDTKSFLEKSPSNLKFDLIVTSPPYNIGKSYEKIKPLENYLSSQEKIIDLLVEKLAEGGSLCWQIGNFVSKNEIIPLDILLYPFFKKHNLQLRNRIIWRFGHGLHNTKRFSGRYEVVLWYTKTIKNKPDYTFNLNNVRIRSKYPGKRYFKGPNAGKISSNPLGKNPEDVWDIPNVKSNHIEKTTHPCQFPVGLIERIILALTNKDDLVFDPFCGVASAGVACAIHGRKFWGTELSEEYIRIGQKRLKDALNGKAKYRPHNKPIYDHTKSKLSKIISSR